MAAGPGVGAGMGLVVVPTVYTDINEHIILSNQIDNVRVAYFTHLLLLFFYVRFVCSPSVMVTFTEQHVSFLHFLTNVCAIVGGVFTVSGIIDSFVYHSQRAIKKKMEIGKFN
ncbi:hypothetical protein Zm00014a_013344 [Zea mays]|uniref:Endoplasmic reticulum vesicle transporter C-terminal domain-containing protein n=1 Tax=Zea mays TaxID=4577 RepID=A0A3L6G264_MAIZE|nr:hypothetical protein Zm00014a_013344 [Zea mays]